MEENNENSETRNNVSTTNTTVQSGYNVMLGIHGNGLCYKGTLILRDNFTKEL